MFYLIMCLQITGLAQKSTWHLYTKYLANPPFIFGIKSNRCIATARQDVESGQFQQVKSRDWNDGDCNTVYLKNIAFPVKLLKKDFTNEDGSTGTLYLVTNDLTIDADRTYEVYQKRWRIEEFHKSMKTSMNHFAIRQKLLLKANQIMFNELQLRKPLRE